MGFNRLMTFMPSDRSSLSENPEYRLSKVKPFSQEMHLKIPLLKQVWNCQFLNQSVGV
jgi:hypothetical protein